MNKKIPQEVLEVYRTNPWDAFDKEACEETIYELLNHVEAIEKENEGLKEALKSVGTINLEDGIGTLSPERLGLALFATEILNKYK
jgi:hypothetical protein